QQHSVVAEEAGTERTWEKCESNSSSDSNKCISLTKGIKKESSFSSSFYNKSFKI
ncbi:10564_t:CDS:2, partial [Scutellospora calospora]